jgi:F-type H+-transporting ATPase subunit c
MYKKLFLIPNFSFNFIVSLIVTTVVAFGCISFIIFSFFDITSVFAMNFNLVNSSIFFSLEENSVIDTEIVARRIGSGLATAGLGGVGTGIGLVFSGLIKGFSRNPSLKDDLFSYAIFGFALTEAIGLFALMMAFMLLYA